MKRLEMMNDIASDLVASLMRNKMKMFIAVTAVSGKKFDLRVMIRSRLLKFRRCVDLQNSRQEQFLIK